MAARLWRRAKVARSWRIWVRLPSAKCPAPTCEELYRAAPLGCEVIGADALVALEIDEFDVAVVRVGCAS